MLSEDKLIFLSCLPRSGSTLLQSMLATSGDVYTESEPWVMLPIVDIQLDNTLETVYNKNTASGAVKDFLKEIPEPIVNNAVKNYSLQLYSAKMSGKFNYFLDKTPRYYLIADTLEDIFPASKHLYLTRNPIAILCSLYNSWASEDLDGLLNYQVDLVDGVRMLAQKVSTTNHLVSSYEDLLQDPDGVFGKLKTYTGLKITDTPLRYTHSTDSKLGDKQALIQSETLNPLNLNMWQESLSDPVLSTLARAYLESIDSTVFDSLGYCKQATEAVLQEAAILYNHNCDADIITIAGMSLENFFAGKGTTKALTSWFSLRKHVEHSSQKLTEYESQKLKDQQDLAECKSQKLKDQQDLAECKSQKLKDQQDLAEHKSQKLKDQQDLAEYKSQKLKDQQDLAEYKSQKLKDQQDLAEYKSQKLKDQQDLAEYKSQKLKDQQDLAEYKSQKLKDQQDLAEYKSQKLKDQQAKSLLVEERNQLTTQLKAAESSCERLSERLAYSQGQVKNLSDSNDIYEKLAKSKWVKAGNALNHPYKALKGKFRSNRSN